MLIHEAGSATGLTKKAIHYYTDQGLISPAVSENGYRDYSEADIARLRQIYVLRKLGLSTDEIKTVLSDESGDALQTISLRRELSLQRAEAKKALLDKWRCGESYESIRSELLAVENSETITEKLLEAFPGYYGRFICLHFARFLNEPVHTARQQAAFETILSFLDNMPPLSLPADVQAYLTEGTRDISTEQMTAMMEQSKKSIENPEEFLSKNREALAEYLAFKQSDAYRHSPAYKAMTYLQQFHQASGYNDVFIPALKELSPSYAAYYEQLETANEKLLAQYPAIAQLDAKPEV